MSKMLNLSECLLAMGRELHDQGRTREARKLFARLVQFRDLPRTIAEEAHSRLAELLLADKQFRKARRHLAVLMCYRPGQGKYFFQYALSIHRDKKADANQAVKYYQQALDIDPSQARWWSAYGKLLIEIGRTTEAVAAMQQAYELAANEPAILGRLVQALCLHDQVDEARSALRVARFANPRDGRFQKLWNDFQFTRAVASQNPADADPVILPFVLAAALPFGNPGPRSIVHIDDARPVPMPPQRRSAIRREK